MGVVVEIINPPLDRSGVRGAAARVAATLSQEHAIALPPQYATFSLVKLAHLFALHSDSALGSFFTRTWESLSLPHAALLGEYFTTLMRISWLSPSEQPDESSLQQAVDRHLAALNQPSLPVQVVGGGWTRARAVSEPIKMDRWGVPSYASSARQAARLETVSANRRRQWDIVSEAARDIAEERVRHAVPEAFWQGASGALSQVYNDAALSAAWFVAPQERMEERGYRNGNPWKYLVDGVYASGYWPLGTRGNSFFVFVPPLRQARESPCLPPKPLL